MVEKVMKSGVRNLSVEVDGTIYNIKMLGSEVREICWGCSRYIPKMGSYAVYEDDGDTIMIDRFGYHQGAMKFRIRNPRTKNIMSLTEPEYFHFTCLTYLKEQTGIDLMGLIRDFGAEWNDGNVTPYSFSYEGVMPKIMERAEQLMESMKKFEANALPLIEEKLDDEKGGIVRRFPTPLD